MARADRVLGEMTGILFRTTSLSIHLLGLEDVPEVAGDSTRAMLAVYTRLSGARPGHACFLFEPQTAEHLADQMVGPGQPQKLRESALCELCNVAGSALLNSVSDALGLSVVPGPPLTVQDMSGAVLQSVAAALATQSRVTVVQAVMDVGGECGPAYFLLLPECPVHPDQEGRVVS
jgi:chemotaxis protein CheC